MIESIPRREAKCCEDGTPLSYGSEGYSLLYREGVTWIRADYCQACWEKKKEALLEKAETFWKFVILQKEDKKESPDLKALELLKTLVDLKKRFVLALYLERKQQIQLRKEDTKLQRLLFEILESGEIIEVQPTLILPEEATRISEELAHTIDGFK